MYLSISVGKLMIFIHQKLFQSKHMNERKKDALTSIEDEKKAEQKNRTKIANKDLCALKIQ